MNSFFLHFFEKSVCIRMGLVMAYMILTLTMPANGQSAVDVPPGITAQEMIVPDTISFEEKIKRHVNIASKADVIRSWALRKRDEVLAANGTAKEYAAYNEEWLNANKTLLPYRGCYALSRGFGLMEADVSCPAA